MGFKSKIYQENFASLKIVEIKTKMSPNGSRPGKFRVIYVIAQTKNSCSDFFYQNFNFLAGGTTRVMKASVIIPPPPSYPIP